MRYLLDTHVLLWWFSASHRLSSAQAKALDQVTPNAPLLVAGISLWEVAMLSGLGRIDLRLPLREWLEAATAPPLVRRLDLTPAIAAEVAALPTTFHRDPADRILVATARVHDATLLTLDTRIIESRLVRTL